MRRILPLMIALTAVLISPPFAQKAEIEAVSANWIDFFSKGDFAGVASLYTEDATAFPPGSPIVKGRGAIGAMWTSVGNQVSEPKLTTLDIAAREIGTFVVSPKGAAPQQIAGKYVVVWEKIGSEWKIAINIWNDGK
jgi:uncharacterized protein (TIGR02246 family)